ncbi:MAG TPA: hypothetical protein VFK33_06055 [Bacillales bacterium]|nr:hypothetical protein [Bacillales bacterium]
MFSILPMAIVGIATGAFLARWSYKFYSPLPKGLQNRPWLVGIILAFVNFMILSLTVVPFFIALFAARPPLIIMIYWCALFIGPFLSVYVWVIFKRLVGGGFQRRLVVSAIGQSVYMLLLIYLIYQYVANFRYLFFGDDPFMQALGSMIGGVICFCATFIGMAVMISPLQEKDLRP